NPSTPYIGPRPNLILLPDSSRRRLMARIVVLRMGHRIPLDWRLTTHVCLTARALGAEGVIISDIEDKEVVAKVRDVAYRFGGEFSVETGVPWKQVIQGWKQSGGIVIHLTAYGLPLSKVVDEIRKTARDLLFVVGLERDPGELCGID